VQTLTSKSYASDCAYEERIAVGGGNDVVASVDGDWSLKSTTSLLTGEPSLIVSVEPGTVKYGPTATKADHWKSVRSMNMLNLVYLDNDVRVMRGNTSTDTVFVFRRQKSFA